MNTSATLWPLTRDMLTWLAAETRTYSQVMEAWKSSCPRLTIWEDALADGLVAVKSAGASASGEATVVVTPRGRAALAEATG